MSYDNTQALLYQQKRISEMDKKETGYKDLINIEIYFYYYEGKITYERLMLSPGANSTIGEIIKNAIENYNSVFASQEKKFGLKPQSDYYLVEYYENEENYICGNPNMRDILDELKSREKIPYHKKINQISQRKFNLVYNMQDIMLGFRKKGCNCSCVII